MNDPTRTEQTSSTTYRPLPGRDELGVERVVQLGQHLFSLGFHRAHVPYRFCSSKAASSGLTWSTRGPSRASVNVTSRS